LKVNYPKNSIFAPPSLGAHCKIRIWNTEK
jgi:hypothetical protein